MPETKFQVSQFAVTEQDSAALEGMKEIQVVIMGISPLMMHNPAGMKLHSGPGTKKIPTAEAEAEAGTYRIDDGSGRGPLYVPNYAIRSCLINGAKGYRVGKTSAVTVLSGAMMIQSEICPLLSPGGGPIYDYEIDQRRAVVQRQGIVRARPRIFPWAVGFSILYDPEFIGNTNVLRDFLSRAGRMVGLLEFRPERKGWFGKFKIVDWLVK